LNGKKQGRSNATPTNHTYRFMKKLLLFALASTLALPLAAFAQGGLKVGTVDMNRAFKEYSKTKEAESKINSARDAAKKEFDDRADAYKKALEEVNNLNKQLDAPALSADAKTQKAKERDDKINNIKNMEREINEFRQTRERQLQEQALRMREGIVKEITDIVMDRVKTQNMDLVFDKSGMSLNGVPLVMYARDNYDFTNDVVAALNKPGRASSVSTDAKASDTISTSPASTRTAPSTLGTGTRPSPATTATPRKP
jgi:outer membrane protein